MHADPLKKENVSRETSQKLEAYLALLKEWNGAYNLVGAKTLEEGWQRHVEDCAQLAPFIKDKSAKILDVGTGAGLPGLVLAILGYENVILVESNQKKGAFLREASRILGVAPRIYVERVEDIPPFLCDVITARAFAGLDKLLKLCAPFAAAQTQWLLLKGGAVDNEIQDALKNWEFERGLTGSATSMAGHILRLHQVHRKVD